jgi:hypothetical protein
MEPRQIMTEMTTPRCSARNRAYVLIHTEAGKAAEVVKSLRGRLGIAMVDVIEGPYNVIAVVEGANLSAVAKTILVDIKKLSGVRDIIVYLVTPEAEVKT